MIGVFFFLFDLKKVVFIKMFIYVHLHNIPIILLIGSNVTNIFRKFLSIYQGVLGNFHINLSNEKIYIQSFTNFVNFLVFFYYDMLCAHTHILHTFYIDYWKFMMNKFFYIKKVFLFLIDICIFHTNTIF